MPRGFWGGIGIGHGLVGGRTPFSGGTAEGL
jgi:gamma-glutamyltranspeptidase/glutathione hydrolase